VRVRLSGEPADLEHLAQFLGRGGTSPEGAMTEVLEESGLYASRRGPGWRLYLTIRITTGDQS
jgi:hypothetical protein